MSAGYRRITIEGKCGCEVEKKTTSDKKKAQRQFGVEILY